MTIDQIIVSQAQNFRHVSENTLRIHQLKIGRLESVKLVIAGGVVGVADALFKRQRRLSLRERVGSLEVEPGGVLFSKPNLYSFWLSACRGSKAPCPGYGGRQGRAQLAGARHGDGGKPCSHHERIGYVSRSGVRWAAGVSLAMVDGHNPSHGIDTLTDDCLFRIQL